MKKSGFPSKAPGGYGTIHEGYRRIYVKVDGKRIRKFEHVVVWEQANGPLPKGWIIHHKDGNKLNNEISNLEAMSRSDHLKEHAGHFEENGVTKKPCTICKKAYTLDLFYDRWDKFKSGDKNVKRYKGKVSRCVFCHAEMTKEWKLKQKALGKKVDGPRIGRTLYGPPAPRGLRRKSLSGLLQSNQETSEPEK